MQVQGTHWKPWLLLTDWPVEDEQQAVRIFALYRQRWAVDINHGFAKLPVENSEVAKKRETLEKRRANVQRFGEAAPHAPGRTDGQCLPTCHRDGTQRDGL